MTILPFQLPTRPESVSVVMPAYDEAEGITAVIAGVQAVLATLGIDHELVVVDDGSGDATAEIATEAGADVVVSLPENRGYGAALKTGIARAHHDTVVIIDADGTYPPEAIPAMLEQAARYHMVVAARTGDRVHVPWVRRPAKWFLRMLASYLAGRRIPDLNSGLRLFRKDLVVRFGHLLPSGFSFTTTITLAALSNDVLVAWHPVDYHPRVGRSKIRPGHAFDFLLLVLRTIVYFNPLKVFLPLGAVLFLVGAGKLAYDIVIGNLSETAIMGFLGAAVVWAVGLLSDQIARLGARSP